MVSKRQREARKRFREANPHLLPRPEPNLTSDTAKKKKKKTMYGKKKKKKEEQEEVENTTGSGIEAALRVRSDGGATKKNRLKKHPLRVPGMRPGECCFICKANDHIAKSCPRKSDWERNKICLHCRQRGHSFKNCPDKGKDGNDKKYCYNCGESGHSLFKCPQPLQDGGATFANCFICKEKGHLSRNCPKNSHGIYPKGGSCKVCGQVTHLAKDCPSKGGKNASSLEMQANKQAEQWQGKLTVFHGGDDLEDDFTIESEEVKRAKMSQPHANTDSLASESATALRMKPKKKPGSKVVNFVG